MDYQNMNQYYGGSFDTVREYESPLWVMSPDFSGMCSPSLRW